MAILEKNIRLEIVRRLTATVGPAKILKRNPYSMNKQKWVGAFTHEYEDNGPKEIVHAWFVKRYLAQKNLSENHYTYGFNMVGYYGFRFGSEDDNSEDEFQAIIDNVITEFNEDDNWNWESGESDYVNGEELLTPNIGITQVGKSKYIHIAPFQFTLQLRKC